MPNDITRRSVLGGAGLVTVGMIAPLSAMVPASWGGAITAAVLADATRLANAEGR